ncbi:ribonuclease Y [Kiritimatiella glycovorans]|uniref:Ribonuclease Y n=1 Tax=Kiritimatiella glycovorans TaxID=1307763 RepID=A0A0G3EH58_9BACT|nr:ribonuclease Y [Kiritimatiella glycovorans]AKJ65693.1 Ribonuclease Y [Kiritimatiella glycovorans]
MGYEYDWWQMWQDIIVPLGFVVLGFFFHAYLTKANAVAASKQAKSILEDAEKQAESIRREAQLNLRDQELKVHEKAHEEQDSARKELVDLENRIMKREKDFDRKLSLLDQKEQQLEQQISEAERKEQAAEARRTELDELIEQENRAVQKAAEMSRDEARETIMKRLQEALSEDSARLIRHAQNEARVLARTEARKIVVSAIERYAGEQANDVTTTTVDLPSDEMKGRIIGREGRNIRAFESTTGINLIIDETPGVVTLSGFDPTRRETARITLERLIEDGRIQPARIEEIFEKTSREVDDTIRKAGEDVLFQLGLQGVAPELVSLVGRLKFRHSYSQNVLQHSLETAFLMGSMAADLGLDPSVAKRVGIFHDIGKAVDHEVEGPHALIGGKLLRRHGESPEVYNAVAAHHHEMDVDSIYATLASSADAISASRPGARSDTTENYLKRLSRLENVAGDFEGVNKAFAIQAGRELRVIVAPSEISDEAATLLARDIAKKIEQEVRYPGQIKVTVIRETRCIEYAQ